MRHSVWEFKEFWFPRGTTREEAKALMVEAAEIEHWELARTRIWPDGRRHIVLRRRKIRVVGTLS